MKKMSALVVFFVCAGISTFSQQLDRHIRQGLHKKNVDTVIIKKDTIYEYKITHSRGTPYSWHIEMPDSCGLDLIEKGFYYDRKEDELKRGGKGYILYKFQGIEEGYCEVYFRLYSAKEEIRYQHKVFKVIE